MNLQQQMEAQVMISDDVFFCFCARNFPLFFVVVCELTLLDKQPTYNNMQKIKLVIGQRLLASRCESSRRRAADAERQIRLLHYTAFVQSWLPSTVTQTVGRHVRSRTHSIQRLRLFARADDAELRHNRGSHQVARPSTRRREEKQAATSASLWSTSSLSGLIRKYY